MASTAGRYSDPCGAYQTSSRDHQGQKFGTNVPSVTFSLGSVQHVLHRQADCGGGYGERTGNFTVTSTGSNRQQFQQKAGR